MSQLRSALIVLTFSVLALSLDVLAQDWQELDSQGDQLFGEENFSLAAEKYNQSGQLALAEGNAGQAKVILTKLGLCFTEDRLDDPDLLRRYVNSTAFAYLEAAHGETFANSTDYLRRAAYLLHFHDLDEHLPLALSLYRARVLGEVDFLIDEAENLTSSERWGEAGTRYFEAAVLLFGLDESGAGNLFGLALEYLARGGEAAISEGGPWNLSQGAQFYSLGATATRYNHTDGSELLERAGDGYSLAGEAFLAAGRLTEARNSFSEAARNYEKAGMSGPARQSHIQSAEISIQLATTVSYGGHLHALEAGRQYDSVGSYREADHAYAMALETFPITMDLPWMHIELLEILGSGRRTTQARRFADLLSAQNFGFISFFGAPSFGGYDLMSELGSDVMDESKDRLLYRTHVTETLLIACGFLISHLPEGAEVVLKNLEGDVLLMDPPNKAFYDLLLGISGQASLPTDFETKRVALEELFLDDLVVALDDVPPGPLWLPVPRRSSMLRSMLADLNWALQYDRPLEHYAIQAQDIIDELVKSRVRNATKHIEVMELEDAMARSWLFRGILNQSGDGFSQASYHACAGEDYEKAILFCDMTVGIFEARTFYTAAAYSIAEAMLEDNQTLKDEARRFILGNLSSYMDPWDLSVLLSVLDGTIELGGTGAGMRALGMGFIAGFLLLTSYIILLWEPKHPPEGRDSRERGTELEDRGSGAQAGKPDEPSDDEGGSPGGEGQPPRTGARDED